MADNLKGPSSLKCKTGLNVKNGQKGRFEGALATK